MADGAHLPDECEIALALVALDELQAELTRLRRVEDAARRFLNMTHGESEQKGALEAALDPTCLVCHRSVHDHAPDCDVWKPVGDPTCG
jgi:hypothetical protein